MALLTGKRLIFHQIYKLFIYETLDRRNSFIVLIEVFALNCKRILNNKEENFMNKKNLEKHSLVITSTHETKQNNCIPISNFPM